MSKEHDHSCCGAACQSSSLYQTLDELEFEKSIFYACVNGDLDRCKYLIDKHGRSVIDSQDQSGYTPLAYAARNNHLPICRLLISMNADPNLKTKSNQMTPLHRAALIGHVEVVKLLTAYKRTDLFAKDVDDRTALQVCLERIVELEAKLNLLKTNAEQYESKDASEELQLDFIFRVLNKTIEDSDKRAAINQRDHQTFINFLKTASFLLATCKHSNSKYLSTKLAKLGDLTPVEYLLKVIVI